MQSLLRKRILRELKKNALRYVSLFLLIVLGMYVVVSVVAAADNIMIAEENANKKYQAEDGQFTVFVPLGKGEVASLKQKGLTIEEQFYMDYEAEDDGTIRVFKDRDKINKVMVYEGESLKKDTDLLLERNYARVHGYQVGDSVRVGESTFTIRGIVTTSDYEQPLKEMSDSAIQSDAFGTAFVTKKAYDKLKNSGTSTGSEAYTYAYRLNGSMTDKKLQEHLRELKADKNAITDVYFKDMVDQMEKKRTDMEQGVHELTDGTKELHNGLDALKENNRNLEEGASQIIALYLREANRQIRALGREEYLTEENYSSLLKKIQQEEKQDSSVVDRISSLIENIDSLEQYKEGIHSYTQAESKVTSGSKKLHKGMEELEKNTKSLLKNTFAVEIDNLTSFVKKADNPRIGAASDDVKINKYAGITSGVIVMILFTFVISVFVIHNIEQENTVIGALYALGVKKKQLLLHYLTLPVLVTLVAGIVGTVLGFSNIGMISQEQDTITYYSVPQIPAIYPVYLIIYGVIMPPVIAAVVNFLVISRKLGEAPLMLLRNEKKKRRVKRLNVGKMPYIRMFQLRQFLREYRSGVAILFGLLLSLLIVMVGANCYTICSNMVSQNTEDTKYNYMYSYKYPTNAVPEGGEACYMETLKKEALGYKLDVCILGIDKKNPYFPFKVEKGQNKVSVSKSAAIKFHLKEGDKIVLSDEINERDYAFTVDKIVPYSVGLYVFMDIGSMRELFGQEKKYYNVVYSSKPLAIEEGRLYATTTKEQIKKSSAVFLDMMYGMIKTMVGMGIIIFVVVMYLMMKVAIDRSSSSIALMKVLGYREKEIRMLYLDGNFYLVAAGGILAIALAKWIIDGLYPYFVSNVSCGMDLTMKWWIYPMIYAGIILCYLCINTLLVRKLQKVVPAEILKNRQL